MISWICIVWFHQLQRCIDRHPSIDQVISNWIHNHIHPYSGMLFWVSISSIQVYPMAIPTQWVVHRNQIWPWIGDVWMDPTLIDWCVSIAMLMWNPHQLTYWVDHTSWILSGTDLNSIVGIQWVVSPDYPMIWIWMYDVTYSLGITYSETWVLPLFQ